MKQLAESGREKSETKTDCGFTFGLGGGWKCFCVGRVDDKSYM
jgi:hypothetical protein